MKKLSDFSGVQGLSVYAKLSPLVNEVAESETITAALRKITAMSEKERNTTKVGRKFMEDMVGVMLGEKPEATMRILAVLNEKDVGEMQTVPAPELWTMTQELLTDKDFTHFFYSYVDIQAAK